MMNGQMRRNRKKNEVKMESMVCGKKRREGERGRIKTTGTGKGKKREG